MDLYTAGRCVAHRLRHLGGFALAHGLMQVTWLTKRTTLSERRSERNPNGHNIGSIYDVYIYIFFFFFGFHMGFMGFFCIFAYTLMVDLI